MIDHWALAFLVGSLALLALRATVLSKSNIDHASQLINLGRLRNRQGSHAEGERLFRKALAIRERAFGPDHPQVAVALNSLAMAVGAQARHSEAEALFG
jgi:hypothetical protein